MKRICQANIVECQLQAGQPEMAMIEALGFLGPIVILVSDISITDSQSVCTELPAIPVGGRFAAGKIINEKAEVMLIFTGFFGKHQGRLTEVDLTELDGLLRDGKVTQVQVKPFQFDEVLLLLIEHPDVMEDHAAKEMHVYATHSDFCPEFLSEIGRDLVYKALLHVVDMQNPVKQDRQQQKRCQKRKKYFSQFFDIFVLQSVKSQLYHSACTMSIYILGIESSCDDTSAAVIRDRKILANLIANQHIHKDYGGVVPELASRAHQQHIIPVIAKALSQANIQKNELHAVAYTNGPGLLGSLLVGTSFAKGFALSMGIPLITVNHMHAHILAHFIEDEQQGAPPPFPFLCLTVSGGHTQIVLVKGYHEMEVIGQTIDDAAGEAFDKAAKIMGLPYPGGPLIDKLAKEGDPNAFAFPHPRVPGLNYSFSGLKTSILYFLRDQLKKDADFIGKHKQDLAASIQHNIVEILMKQLRRAVKQTGISDIAMAGGVSANSGLREAFRQEAQQGNWRTYIPKFEYCTDNAAMIAITGYFKYLEKDFSAQDVTPFTRFS